MQEKTYSPKEAERKWGSYWQQKGIFNFNPNSKKPVFAIDTPPPTVSGIIHVGHIFSYSQADFIASYKRMKGMNVFYPFGFDDNGLPTEKHVEKTRGIKAKQVGRKEFNKIVREEVVKVEKEFKRIWSSVGLSCDWNLFYSTISPPVQKLSQLSFIELYEKGREYRKEAPTLWCPNCETAIAQVELEDKQLSTKFSDIFFELDSGEKLTISTTRPELLSACVAVLVHPEDEKNRHLIGRKVMVPLFDYLVPIIGDRRVDKEKGSGIVMCCTFGDTVDVEWWKAYALSLKIVLNPDGTLNEKAGKYKGMKLKEAREAILNDLKEKGLLGEQREISHTVNTHDRCGTEIEFLLTKQWFIKYLDLKEEFLKAGRKLKWFPPHMRNRYENWIKGLQWDWCISRQRYYGIPFPVWYCKKCGETILAEKKDLPVDPLTDKPKKKCKCGSNEFIPENDILDTWTTSSLTPLINSKWKGSTSYDKKIFPMSLRPQAHDIISFWAFNTIVKSLLHTKKIPWENIMISGWGLDPKGKKMSKSKGNLITPQEILEKYSADALRYWASSINLGTDAPFQEKDVATGQKFITKLWNSSRFTLMNLKSYKGQKPKKLEPMDKWLLHKLNELVKDSTKNFDSYQYGKAKAEAELFFWKLFCDNYLEIIKDRIYNPEKRGKNAKLSAQFTLNYTLNSVLKLFAPITPFITEEIYQSFYAKKEKKKSILISDWPSFNKKFTDKKAEKAGDKAIELIAAVRQFKAKNQKSLKVPVKLTLKEKEFQEVKPVLEDLIAVTKAEKIEKGKELKIEFI